VALPVPCEGRLGCVGADCCPVDCCVVCEVTGDPLLGFFAGAGSGAGVGGSAVVGTAESPAADGGGV
jgi:hypothetical protein